MSLSTDKYPWGYYKHSDGEPDHPQMVNMRCNEGC
jgi:hypothetical protein